jgi:hypothetical protein
MLSDLKNRMVPDTRKPRTIVTGAFQGIKLDLSLRNQFQLYAGLYERELYPWLRRLTKGAVTAVDLGASYGEFTLYFLKAGVETVYAFEPDAECFGLFEKNLRLNAYFDPARVILSSKRIGAADSEGEARLDSCVAAFRYPCVIKMDIEGGEVAALEGACRLNTKADVRWLIETHSKALEAECLRILSEESFRTRIISPAWWRAALPELRPLESNRWLAAWK